MQCSFVFQYRKPFFVHCISSDFRNTIKKPVHTRLNSHTTKSINHKWLMPLSGTHKLFANNPQNAGTPTNLRVVHIDLVLLRDQRPIATVNATLQPSHALPQSQRVLLASKSAQHLEEQLHTIGEPLAARRLHADRDLFGQIGGRR